MWRRAGPRDLVVDRWGLLMARSRDVPLNHRSPRSARIQSAQSQRLAAAATLRVCEDCPLEIHATNGYATGCAVVGQGTDASREQSRRTPVVRVRFVRGSRDVFT